MIRFLSLSSGSSGNCYFFTDGKVSFLIDAGVGPRSCAKKLSEHSLSLGQVDFILVTHDHIDHIKALGIISSRLCKPVYTTERLKSALLQNICTRGRMGGNLHTVREGEKEVICGVEVTCFEVRHDATQTIGYSIRFDGKTITLVTDCGRMTPQVFSYVRESDILILESNYDEKMLAEGDYPPVLQERIRGGNGHLSNTEAARTLKNIFLENNRLPKHIFLCHLSDNNNTPELALSCSLEALMSSGADRESFTLDALPRGKASGLYTF
ncbi:MAG: MBL fold metallo-hydrolase [Bacteroidales bacterium]|nr:MBL fold metallo-hydrolase [Bacteroidales bacterium]